MYSVNIILNCAHVFRVYFAGSVGPVVLVLHGGGHSALSWALFTVSDSAHTRTHSTKLLYINSIIRIERESSLVIAKTPLTSAELQYMAESRHHDLTCVSIFTYVRMYVCMYVATCAACSSDKTVNSCIKQEVCL